MSRTPGGAYQSGGKPVENLKPPPKGPGLGHGQPIPKVMDKPWECPECGRRFARETDLRRHTRNTHYIIRPGSEGG